MRNLLVVLLLLTLNACTTAENMSREVPRWFGRDVAKTIRSDAGAPAPMPAPEAVPAPITVESAALPDHRQGLKANPVKVALLLPLSGDKAALGKSFLDAAQMAVMDMGGEGFELMPKDSGAEPAQAARAAAEAASNGATLIVGPVFGAAIPAVRQAAPALPVLALSNDWTMAGGNAYVMGFNPAEQARRIANFAAERNLQNIAVLVPSSVYGEVTLDALQAGPVRISSVHRYQKNRESIDKAVAEIAAKIDMIDAIFIPDGGGVLAGISESLTKNGISAKKKPILGTGLWDEEDVTKSVALIGGYYAAPDPAARQKFVARYQKNYGRTPPRLATLAYDTTALAAVLAAQRRGYDEAALTNPSGFVGLDGIFRITSGHIAERGLAVMQVTAGGPKVVDQAPKHF